MKEYYSIIKIDESLDEQIEIPKKVLESEVYKVAIDILHEGEYWLHTHRKKTLDDSMELIEQYANQKVIEELDKLQNNYVKIADRKNDRRKSSSNLSKLNE